MSSVCPLFYIQTLYIGITRLAVTQQLMSSVCPLFYIQTLYIGITRLAVTQQLMSSVCPLFYIQTRYIGSTWLAVMQQLMSSVCPLFYVQTRYIGITRLAVTQQLMSSVCPLFYIQTPYIGIMWHRASDCSFDGRHLSLEMTCDPVRINLLDVDICSPRSLSLPTLITRQQFSDQWRVKAKWTQVDSVDSVCVCVSVAQSVVFLCIDLL